MTYDWRDLPAPGDFSELAPAGAAQNLSVEVEVSLPAEILARIQIHVSSDTSREAMGLLLGNASLGPGSGRISVRVEDSFAVRQAKATAESVVMLKSAWSCFWRRSPQRECLALIGWYHSHPNYGVMLSTTDRNTQRTWFPHAWQIALVLDPVRGESAAYAGKEVTAAALIIAGA